MKNSFFSWKIDKATLMLLSVAIITSIITFVEAKYELNKGISSIIFFILAPLIVFFFLRKGKK